MNVSVVIILKITTETKEKMKIYHRNVNLRNAPKQRPSIDWGKRSFWIVRAALGESLRNDLFPAMVQKGRHQITSGSCSSAQVVWQDLFKKEAVFDEGAGLGH